MHASIGQYLEALHIKQHASDILKVVYQDLTHFVAWWEYTQQRTFDPVLLRYEALRDRQRDDGIAPATINRGLVLLHGYCHWATTCHLLVENSILEIQEVPIGHLAPRSLPTEALDTILRARDEVIYTGLRVQEVCDMQLHGLRIRKAKHDAY